MLRGKYFESIILLDSLEKDKKKYVPFGTEFEKRWATPLVPLFINADMLSIFYVACVSQ